MIPANVHSDDFVWAVNFDATPWFEQATFKEIIELINCDWAGNYPADAVALFFEDQNQEIQQLMAYCRKSDNGFEVSVGQEEAEQWLKCHRSNLFPKFEELSELQKKEKEVCLILINRLTVDELANVTGFISQLKNSVIEEMEESHGA